MEITYENEEGKEIKTNIKRKIEIKLNNDIDYQISLNNFGELEVRKVNFGKGNSSIIIQPSVSNEIRLS